MLCMSNINEYCWLGRVGNFLSLDQETWIASMKSRFQRVTSFPLTKEQERAWRNSFDVLQSALTDMGDAYQKLHLVFEYCLPMYPPRKDGTVSDYVVRADAILVSADTAVVLEFKDRDDAIVHHARAARKYRSRLQKYHDESVGMRKWSVLIPTLATDLCERKLNRVTACSPDRLAEELVRQLGDHPKAHPDISRWRRSGYSQK